MRLRCGLLGLGLVLVGCAAVRAQRLPGGVTPEHYSLTITPDLAKARFAGSETIDVVVEKPTRVITLNAAEIEFVSVKGWAGAGATATATTKANAGVPPLAALGRDDASGRAADGGQTAVVVLDAGKEQATLTFGRELPVGRVVLEIAYTGILNDKLRGFYLSKSKTRNYGVTQFEATDARRAFPCFDEPALKATFDVTLVVDAGDTAISNTKIVRDTPEEAGKHKIEFAPTPKMSTYLLAWVVGDFQCSKAKADGVPIRACATPDKLRLTKFAVDAAKWNLKYYDSYFGIKYPMAKLDLVAIPDFEAGAMENFGCITFRETELLVDGKNGALPAKKEVATTVAHEMAHQWFGDLVTPQWWDNLWLNEGFATWMETKAAAKWQPKWHFDQDVATDLNHTLDADAGRTTRPIRQQAETPAEINALFDDIAYGKAGAVIGMVENWVGEETFRKGVQAYLGAHLYGNATAEDFWDTQTRVSGLPVDTVMRSFVDQPGVPLVTLGGAMKDPTHDGKVVMNGAPSVRVAQGEFLLSGTGAATDCTACVGSETVWTIPVCVRGDGCEVVGPGMGQLAAPASGFLFADAGDKGYYRTAYSADEWKAIKANVETGLTPAERIGLLGDEWALTRAEDRSVSEFLDLVLAVKLDPNAAVLDSALGRVGTIEAQIATDADRERLNAVVRREFDPVYAALGGPEKHEKDDHADLRETLFEELGNAKDPAVMAEAESMAKQLFAGQKAADPTLADAAVALATVKGDVGMYEKMQRVGRNATDPDIKEAALRALTRFEAPELVIRTLEHAVSGEVRNQDAWMLVALLLERRATQDLAWEYVQQHWAAIERKATESSETRIVEATGAFCTAERRDEVASFFQAHPVEGSERTLAKSVDSINDCIHLRAAQEPELRAWLGAHGGE
ncbi:MAG: M1 family metallopeptidase [Acidobacteriaceae bacterium]|jgi:aminopeptidase N/puromycin-sensitive aminopeptidase